MEIQQAKIKTVEIIVLLYNGVTYIKQIINEFENQKTKYTKSLKFVVTNTDDETTSILKNINADFSIIEKKNFSHSLTREKEIKRSNADAVILLTQDCRLVNNNVIEKLVNCLNDNVKFAYLRQINTNKSIEKYTREINYPLKSSIKNKKSINEFGINTFFSSDACSCLDVDFFKKINGYDNKDLPTSEDMYYAKKVIDAGKEVEYCADTFVNHTHSFSLKQIRQRYFLIGEFFSLCPEFKKYHANDSGLKLAWKVLRLILKDCNIKALFSFIPNMLSRYIGEKQGEKHLYKNEKN